MPAYKPAPDAQRHIDEAIDKFQQQIVDDVATDARRNAAVDTGEMRDSIIAEVNGGVGRVSASAEHSAEVELGTRHMPAQPFLRPALYKRRSS